MSQVPLESVCQSYRRARERRASWESLWQECLRYGQPARCADMIHENHARRGGPVDLFDGTAGDSAEQLAASLLAELTPPWSRWFGLAPGRDVDPVFADDIADILEDASERIKAHFDRSNFVVEMHQCLLDLVTVGTSTLQFEEAPAGASSAFRFTAVPAQEMFIDGANNGTISSQFRTTKSTLRSVSARFPDACDWPSILATVDDPDRQSIELTEAVIEQSGRTLYRAFAPDLPGRDNGPAELATGQFGHSPFVTFRWMKGTGELYGRSPLMGALPDVKTANKVVELILKNASIAVTGIWLAEDDGVLNPANIQLVPGSIIPKAAGSTGLTPLQSPGRLDVSQLILDDLRSRIRHAMLTDRLGALDGKSMTATEVLERSAEVSRLLGAIYGRLQNELLTPLIRRALSILARRGEIEPVALDGKLAEIQYLSPMARTQARNEIHGVSLWLETLEKLDRTTSTVVDKDATARWLAQQLGVPAGLQAPDITASDVLELLESTT